MTCKILMQLSLVVQKRTLETQQQDTSQELVGKEIHGTKWKFRHIYRGQPRRHLLMHGWSAFVNKKGLVCGDAVLFLRGDDGVLRLGARSATQPKVASRLAMFCSLQMNDFANVTPITLLQLSSC
ncbi:hypothetical protein Lser_V15G18672 [Lactuca serriola]